jgi:secreted trypsin-like serine protease
MPVVIGGATAALCGALICGALICAALISALISSAAAAPAWGDPSARAAVLGGTPAEGAAFASLAFVLDLKGTLADQCTGTVVAPNLVLTAAHCAENVLTGIVDQPGEFQVVTGVSEWQSPARQLSAVTRVIINPSYVRRTDDGDAALLVLATPTSAPALGLATPADAHWIRAGTPATIAGWGKTRHSQRTTTKRLMQAPTGVQTSKWCARHAQLFDPASEICTIDPPHYLTGGCEGDSGGPLLAVDPATGALVEIGVTIRAEYTCATRFPTVFTRVSKIYPWVHRWILKSQPPATPGSGETTTTTTTTSSTAAPLTP